MKPTTPAEQKDYTELFNRVAKAIIEIRPSHTIMCTVLFKILAAELITKYGAEEGIQRFSDAVNETILDMREKGIFK